ncbi:MAG: hypothetical protein RL120_06355 [Gammaproteobacteria bacterium]
MELGEREPRQVSAGDVVIIPAGVRQRIHNRGAQDLLFLAICSPRFAEHNYRSL